MKLTYACSTALLLAVTTSAWAGGALYPASTDVAGRSPVTRSQVIAEWQESHRLGLDSVGEGDYPTATTAQLNSITAAGERTAGQSSASMQRTAAPAPDVAMTMADQRTAGLRVRAELAEAQRLGLMNNGENGPNLSTPAQETMITAAGQRAVEEERITLNAPR